MKFSWNLCRRNRRKMNNKGMTLVEVIVAMAILAIVITPTLKMFADASGTNLRSRRATRAFTVGESVMECAKAYNVQQLCNQFLGGGFKGINYGPTTSTTAVARNAAGVEETPFLADGTLKEDAAAYVMRATNAESEGNFYDIEMEITPAVAPSAFDIEDRNAYTDAIIMLEEDMNYNAINELTSLAETTFETNFSSYHTAASHTIDSVDITNFVRNITIDIDDSGSAQTVTIKVNYTCTADVNYHYSATVGGSSSTGVKTYDSTIMTYDEIFADDADPTTPEYTLYDNSATVAGVSVNGRPGKLSQVYLYYFPTYPGTNSFGTGAKDVVTVNANLTSGLYDPGSRTRAEAEAEGCQPLKLIIAKQVSTYLDPFDLNDGEVLYSASFTGSLSGGGRVDVWHNLSQNLCSLPSASVVTTPMITGFSSLSSIQDAVKDRVNMLYDVTIRVYDAGDTTNELATYTGTIND